jgi:hypothetical protein
MTEKKNISIKCTVNLLGLQDLFYWMTEKCLLIVRNEQIRMKQFSTKESSLENLVAIYLADLAHSDRFKHTGSLSPLATPLLSCFLKIYTSKEDIRLLFPPRI